MTVRQTFEVAGIDFGISFLTNEGPGLEQELGPIELELVNDGVKIVDTWFNKLPLGIGGMLNGFLEGYAGQLPGLAQQWVDKGRLGLIAYLQALKAHISGTAPAA